MLTGTVTPTSGDATRGTGSVFWRVMDDIAVRDEDDLTARLAEDLDGTFESVVRAHQDRLYTIALRMLGDPGEAQEATQDALLRAYQALRGYDQVRRRQIRLRPWLASIVLNAARNRRRGLAAREPALRLDRFPGAEVDLADRAAAGPEQRQLRNEERDAWAERLLRCPPSQRAALILRHVDGLTYEEIAQVLQRPVGTVKAQVHRGLANLRVQLQAERVIETGAPSPGTEEMSA
jgi:RNA polymerase sigma-70 factor (ECF subfamily)